LQSQLGGGRVAETRQTGQQVTVGGEPGLPPPDGRVGQLADGAANVCFGGLRAVVMSAGDQVGGVGDGAGQFGGGAGAGEVLDEVLT
jgi:hypothetical protein